MSDLEDFFPVWLDIGEAIETLKRFDPSARVSVKFPSYNSPVGILKTSLTATTAGDYLRDVATAQSLSQASLTLLGSGEPLLSPAEMAEMESHHEKGVFLLEGHRASTTPFHVELTYNGAPALTLELPARISSVESFYFWVNLRGFAGGNPLRPTSLATPWNFPSELWNGKNVVFVHGFNVTEREARGWNSEMFKRLWQSGCNAAYYAVTWRGDAGWPNGMFYHDDVTHAFETAPYLSDFVSGLHGDTTLMAHSLGNMVASSAIQDCNLEVARYLMLNAAVPAEAYDASQWNTNVVANRMLHPEWEQYAPRTWSSLWFQLFHNTSDPRMALSWENRFGSVFYLTELYNFHSGTEMSPGDQVLEVSANRPAMLDALHYSFPWTIESGHLAWQKQELGKGRLTGDNLLIAGTTWAGWGHATKQVWHELTPDHHGYFEDVDISAAEANAMTDAQLQTAPAFRRRPSKMFSSSIPYEDRCEILACGIPALSGPAGTRPLDFPSGQGLGILRNIDMQSFKTDSTWPRNSPFFGKRWLHSDLKNIALPHVFGLFDRFCVIGDLQ